MQTVYIQKEHVEGLKALFLDVFSNEPWFDKWEDDQQLDLYIRDLIDNQNSLSLILVDDEGSIVGGSLGYVFHWWEGKEYFIKELFISRNKQNQGLGKLFLEQIYDILATENIKHITLMTERDVPAYSFYQKNGFTELEDSVYFVRKVK
ncbi:aminoglycoside 6'-N-acetyltransferase I [Oceanobacillus limi]|uniref:Aminoglycoside 6'-N-acetyltransferase I n=1 Tax=Oceanobacillus limi TaxID=930131 RepID=A0A1H9Y1R0_9BACI|nr:GNAT family N-acetyltransferase [Oceanobacillus limi]SES62206.1 aminoglycoside 6'-N-acetyltransferase I [Oceanobacillus limi]